MLTKSVADIFRYNKNVFRSLDDVSENKNNMLLPFIEKRRIESLKNVSKWTPYLKYIYSVLYEKACKQYKEMYEKKQLDNDTNIIERYAHNSYNARSLDVAFTEPHKKYIIDTKLFVIEAIEYLLLFEVIYWTQEKNLFNETNLKIEKDLTADKLKDITVDKLITKILDGIYGREDQKSENKDDDSVSRLESDIYGSGYIRDFFRNTCKQSLAGDENGCINLKGELCEIVYSEFKHQINNMMDKIPADKNEKKKDFLQNLFFTALGFACLNNNKLRGNAYYHVCNKILLNVMIKEFSIDYNSLVGAFFNNLEKNGDICPFIYGDGGYNVGSTLLGDKQGHPVYQCLEDKYLNAKEKYPFYIASSEKQLEQREKPKQEKPKQEKSKGICEIF